MLSPFVAPCEVLLVGKGIRCLPPDYCGWLSSPSSTERERDSERERQRHEQREKTGSMQEAQCGLDPGSPGSRPEPKADVQPLSHPGIPIANFYISPQPLGPADWDKKVNQGHQTEIIIIPGLKHQLRRNYTGCYRCGINNK